LAKDIQDVPGGGDAGLLLGGLFARDKRPIVGESIRDAVRRKRRPGEQPAKAISAKSYDPRGDAADGKAFTEETTARGDEFHNSALRERP